MDTSTTSIHRALAMARRHQFDFTLEFLEYLPDNLHIYEAFEQEALSVAQRGRSHYSARTIVEFLRHHSTLQEVCGQWKINDHNVPYLARLFALLNPQRAGLFEFRACKKPAQRACAEVEAA